MNGHGDGDANDRGDEPAPSRSIAVVPVVSLKL
jgi:hypothetical protein